MPEKKVTLEELRFSVQAVFNKMATRGTAFDVVEDFDTEEIIVRLFQTLYGEKLKEIKVPADWMEAFKEEMYKRLNLKHIPQISPVKYKTYTAVALYPEVGLKDEKHETCFLRR